MSKIKAFLKNNCAITAFVVVMAVVYGRMMYTNKPWYDELYTYYFFISKGPLYAAIHWPVPNNHIGYSVLSSILDIFFDNYIGLRGISFISSLANIVLIYRLSKTLFKKNVYGIISAVMLSGNYLVYSLAVQGRGYALGTLCFLTALNCIAYIYMKPSSDGNKGVTVNAIYLLFAISLALGLYAIPSNVYFVIPTCLTGGFVLMTKKRFKEMRKLIYFALLAAIATLSLYTIVWLAIGSNLISKDPGSAYYGVYQIDIILHNPIGSFKTGIEYMLATPYIQSIERARVIKELPIYFRDLFNLFIGGTGWIIAILTILTAIFSGIIAYKKRKGDDNPEYFTGVLLVINVVFIPLMLLIQSVEPYKRVLGYLGVIWALSVTFLVKNLVERIKNPRSSLLVAYVLTVILAVAVAIATKRADVPLADRENDIADLLFECTEKGFNVNDIGSIYYTDDFQKYVLKFYYDVTPVETSLEEAEYVMVSEDLLKADGMKEWPMLTNYENFNMDYVSEYFGEVFSTSKYTLYKKK